MEEKKVYIIGEEIHNVALELHRLNENIEKFNKKEDK